MVLMSPEDLKKLSTRRCDVDVGRRVTSQKKLPTSTAEPSLALRDAGGCGKSFLWLDEEKTNEKPRLKPAIPSVCQWKCVFPGIALAKQIFSKLNKKYFKIQLKVLREKLFLAEEVFFSRCGSFGRLKFCWLENEPWDVARSRAWPWPSWPSPSSWPSSTLARTATTMIQQKVRLSCFSADDSV